MGKPASYTSGEDTHAPLRSRMHAHPISHSSLFPSQRDIPIKPSPLQSHSHSPPLSPSPLSPKSPSPSQSTPHSPASATVTCSPPRPDYSTSPPSSAALRDLSAVRVRISRRPSCSLRRRGPSGKSPAPAGRGVSALRRLGLDVRWRGCRWRRCCLEMACWLVIALFVISVLPLHLPSSSRRAYCSRYSSRMPIQTTKKSGDRVRMVMRLPVPPRPVV